MQQSLLGCVTARAALSVSIWSTTASPSLEAAEQQGTAGCSASPCACARIGATCRAALAQLLGRKFLHRCQKAAESCFYSSLGLETCPVQHFQPPCFSSVASGSSDAPKMAAVGRWLFLDSFQIHVPSFVKSHCGCRLKNIH